MSELTIKCINRKNITSSLDVERIANILVGKGAGKRTGIMVLVESVSFLNEWLSTINLNDPALRMPVMQAAQEYVNKYPLTLIILD